MLLIMQFMPNSDTLPLIIEFFSAASINPDLILVRSYIHAIVLQILFLQAQHPMQFHGIGI